MGWSGLTLAWGNDVRQGSIELLFFYLPFGLLAVSLSRLDWRRNWARVLYGELIVMALVFALVGIEQWINRDIFWNPKLLVGNTYAPFFRVNSVFWDTSIYGRFLVVAILASLVVALFSRSPRAVIAALIAIAVMWLGLLFSFSQSSFIALIAGLVVATAFAWRWRALIPVGVAAAVFLVAVVGGYANVRHAVTNHADGGLNRVTSGRSKLVSNGVKIAVHHPVVGVGIGGFKHAYAKQAGLRGREPNAAASHDTPITVAAETGIVGLALLGWLLVAGFLFTFRRAGYDLAGMAALVFGLVLVSIGVHSLFYNAFFRRRMSIYMGIPPSQQLLLRPVIRLFFQQVVDLNTRDRPGTDPTLRYQVLLLLDEFTLPGRMDAIAKGIAYLGGYNLRLLLVFQSPSQLRAEYGADTALTLETNAAVRILYAQKEEKIAREIADELGTQTVTTQARNQRQGAFRPSPHSHDTTTTSETRRPLLLPQEVKAIGPDKAILLVENLPPILARKTRLLPGSGIPTAAPSPGAGPGHRHSPPRGPGGHRAGPAPEL